MNTLFFCTFFFLFSCSNSEPDRSDPKNQMDPSDPIELNVPCVSEQAAIELPDVLQDQANITQYESTLLLSAIVSLSNEFRSSLSQVLLPPEDAIEAKVDNITVSGTDEGYEWTDGNEKYVYLIRGLGYQIYHYEEGDLAGAEMINMNQDEACTSFEYTQYAIRDEGVKEKGDVEFYYNYQQAGTAKIVSFGADIYDEQNEEYRLRSFEDLSGELTIKKGGEVTQKINWSFDGSGSFQLFENGTIIDEGTWSF